MPSDGGKASKAEPIRFAILAECLHVVLLSVALFLRGGITHPGDIGLYLASVNVLQD